MGHQANKKVETMIKITPRDESLLDKALADGTPA